LLGGVLGVGVVVGGGGGLGCGVFAGWGAIGPGGTRGMTAMGGSGGNRKKNMNVDFYRKGAGPMQNV